MSLPRTLFIVIFSLLPAVAQAQAPAPVTIEQARLDTFSASSWVPGTVISRNDARIAAETGGRVTWVAEVGDFIHAGTPLARVDGTDLQLELANRMLRLLPESHRRSAFTGETLTEITRPTVKRKSEPACADRRSFDLRFIETCNKSRAALRCDNAAGRKMRFEKLPRCVCGDLPRGARRSKCIGV